MKTKCQLHVGNLAAESEAKRATRARGASAIGEIGDDESLSVAGLPPLTFHPNAPI
jgi:hypothetical protein